MLQNNFIKVGIWYVMWDNIGKVKENRECMELLPHDRQMNQKCITESSTDEPMLDSLDCHSSTKGLFTGSTNVKYFSSYNTTAYITVNSPIVCFYTGILLFAFSTSGFIVFSVLSSSPNDNHQDAAVIVNDTFEILILIIMIVVCTWVRTCVECAIFVHATL